MQHMAKDDGESWFWTTWKGLAVAVIGALALLVALVAVISTPIVRARDAECKKMHALCDRPDQKDTFECKVHLASHAGRW